MNGQRGLGPKELRLRIWTFRVAGNWEKQGPQERSQGTEAPETTCALSGGGMATFLKLSASNSPDSRKGVLSYNAQVCDIILALWTLKQKLRPRKLATPILSTRSPHALVH